MTCFQCHRTITGMPTYLEAARIPVCCSSCAPPPPPEPEKVRRKAPPGVDAKVDDNDLAETP